MNREYVKGIAMFVLDLAMELEYQRRYPRRKCIEHGPLDFTFDGEGECVVRHHDGRLGEISIDPDEIVVSITYRRKGLNINIESDKRLTSRDVMDIVGDFLDYDTLEDEPVQEVKRVVVSQAPVTTYPVRKWLIEALVAHMYRTRPESEQGLDYDRWLTCLQLSRDVCGPSLHTDTRELTEMEFCNTVGKLGYLVKEKLDDNIRLVVNMLLSCHALDESLKVHCKEWISTGDE